MFHTKYYYSVQLIINLNQNIDKSRENTYVFISDGYNEADADSADLIGKVECPCFKQI